MNDSEWNSHVWGCDWEVSRETGDLMNRMIIDQVNSKVGDDDDLYLLGDVVFAGSGNQAKRRTQQFLASLRCKRHHLIAGNHDGPLDILGVCDDPTLPQNRESYFDYIVPLYTSFKQACMVYCESGIQIWCSHYPHLTWPRATQTGQPKSAKPHKVQSIHAYGHVHEKYNNERPVLYPERWAAVNVGVDALNPPYSYPYSEIELWKLTERHRKETIRFISQQS